MINLSTGATKYFNVIENTYGREGALFLLMRYDYRGTGKVCKFKVISGSGAHTEYTGFQVGNNPQMHYDQTPNRMYECDWVVVDSGATSLETLHRFMEKTQKRSVGFGVFK